MLQTALSRNLKKKGSFSPEEDQIILQIIRNWDTDDTDDRQYVPAGSGLNNNQSSVLQDYLGDVIGCSSERRSGSSNSGSGSSSSSSSSSSERRCGSSSSSSSARGSVDVAHCQESRQLLLSSSDSSTKEHIDYTGNSLSSPSISSNGAQEWLGTGVGVGTGVRLGTGTGSGTGGRSRLILSPGNVKKNKVPRKGKWVVVGDALNRPPDCCSQRYRDTLIKRPYPLS